MSDSPDSNTVKLHRELHRNSFSQIEGGFHLSLIKSSEGRENIRLHKRARRATDAFEKRGHVCHVTAPTFEMILQFHGTGS